MRLSQSDGEGSYFAVAVRRAKVRLKGPDKYIADWEEIQQLVEVLVQTGGFIAGE